MARHLIGTQIIDVRLPRDGAHFRWQQVFSALFKEEILPILEKAFDRWFPGEEVVRVDRLEIDLGAVPAAMVKHGTLPGELGDQLVAELRELIHPFSPRYAGPPVPRRTSVWEQWLFYMEHGRLAWNGLVPDDRWRRDVLEMLAAEHSRLEQLRSRVRGNPTMLRRIVAEHPEAFLEKLAAVSTACSQDGLTRAVDAAVMFRAASTPAVAARALRHRLWEELLRLAFQGEGRESREPLLSRLEAELLTHGTLLSGCALPNPEWEPPQPDRPAGMPQEGIDGIHAGLLTPETLLSYHVLPDPERGPTAQDPPAGMPLDAMYVLHAGLVLLHPFLKTLFTRLGLLTGSLWTTQEGQAVAVSLLHYLSSGVTAPPEFELVVPKLLCGWDVNSPLPEVTLTRVMTDEAEMVLRAAIARWEKLQATSPEGLREGFLRREGKVLLEAKRTRIQVEQRAIDVLLDYLPWNLGLVRLPWLSKIITVEWR